MFVEFSVKNFRSFKERQTLSLVAASSKELLEENTFPAKTDKVRLLKTAVVYGANASGKTSFFRRWDSSSSSPVPRMRASSKLQSR